MLALSHNIGGHGSRIGYYVTHSESTGKRVETERRCDGSDSPRSEEPTKEVHERWGEEMDGEMDGWVPLDQRSK